MRKIETQMCDAIRNNENWSNANTTVSYDSVSGESEVRLHGNLIARVDDNTLVFYDGGRQSNTTKSRLNAILDQFGIDGERVYQHQFEWFVRLYSTETDSFNDVQFRNGMIMR